MASVVIDKIRESEDIQHQFEEATTAHRIRMAQIDEPGVSAKEAEEKRVEALKLQAQLDRDRDLRSIQSDASRDRFTEDQRSQMEADANEEYRARVRAAGFNRAAVGLRAGFGEVASLAFNLSGGSPGAVNEKWTDFVQSKFPVHRGLGSAASGNDDYKWFNIPDWQRPGFVGPSRYGNGVGSSKGDPYRGAEQYYDSDRRGTMPYMDAVNPNRVIDMGGSSGPSETTRLLMKHTEQVDRIIEIIDAIQKNTGQSGATFN